mgnify:CR=1 FL=1
MKSILLTGSTGFIGSNILKKLYPKYKIFIILRSSSKNKIKLNNHKKIEIINYKNFNQLNKKLQKIKVDVVIHCATHYVKQHSFKDILKLAESNIVFGNIILENLNKMKIKKFINFSSVWEDYDSIKDNDFNLYSVYKKSFSKLVKFYKKKFSNIDYYNIMINNTFGENDNRLKIINVLKKNYQNNRITKIISKNLLINLLNVEDIVDAINLIIVKNTKPNTYLLKNKMSYKIVNIINFFNKNYKKKIKVRWLSNKLINEKIYPYNQLKKWKPQKSKLIDIIKIIKSA